MAVPSVNGRVSEAAQPAFQGIRFTPQLPNGLFVPQQAWETYLQTIEDVEKAGVKAEGLRTQLGTVISQYYTLFANMVTYGAAEKPRGTAPARLLREASRRSLVDATLIEARIHQVRHVAHRVSVEGKEKGFQVVHLRHKDPQFKATKQITERCEAMMELLESPNPEYHPGGIQDFLVKAVRGHLILDRMAMVMVKDSSGKPRSFHLLPPDGIRPRYQALYSILQDNPQFRSMDQAVELVWSRDRVPITDQTAFLQLLEDQRVYGAWSKDEMSVNVANPSDEIDRAGFGISPLEASLEGTTLLLNAFNFNKQVFASNFPEAMGIFQGAVDPEGFEAFKQSIYSQAGPGSSLRLPMFSTGTSAGNAAQKFQLVKLRDSFRDMTFPQLIRMMCALKAAAFRAHPILLNMAPDSGGQRPLISNETQEQSIALAQEEGLHSLLDVIATWLTRELIKPWYDDLKLIFTVQDAPQELDDLNLWMVRTSIGYTIDEFRAAQGQVPLAEATGGQVEGNYVNSPLFFQKMQMDQQAQRWRSRPRPSPWRSSRSRPPRAASSACRRSRRGCRPRAARRPRPVSRLGNGRARA